MATLKCAIGGNSKCTRCLLLTNESPICQVPHPEHLKLDFGSCFGGGSSQFSFLCMACRQTFTIGSNDLRPASQMKVIRGAEYCFQGKHTTKAVKDKRKVFEDVVVLRSGPSLQERID